MKTVAIEIVSNKELWVAAISWALAQILKTLIDLIKEKRVNAALLLSTGGMPSSHTAFVTALTTAVGIQSGFDSPIFAVSAVLSLIVMTDAAGVRRAAGKQAEVLNQIAGLDKKLKELLGHSPLEVAAGAALGVAVAILYQFVFPYGS